MNLRYISTIVGICLVLSVVIAGSVSFSFFMEPVTADLNYERGAFSIYFSLICIVGTITMPFYGRLISRIGARAVIVAGGLWCSAAVFSLSFCQSLLSFYLVGAAIGLTFFGCSFVAGPVLTDNWFAAKKGLVMGIAAACGGCFGMLCSFVLPYIITTWGWRTGYMVLGCLLLLLTLPSGLFLLRNRPEEMGLRPYGADQSSAASDGTPPAGVPFNVALRSPKLWLFCGVMCLIAIAVISVQHLPAHFVQQGFTPVQAGLFISVISAAIIVSNLLMGVMSDAIGLTRTIIIVTLLFILSFVMLIVGRSVIWIVLAMVIMSVGNGYISVLAPVMTGALFGPGDYASIWGIISMAVGLGQGIGPPVWGLIYDTTGSYMPGIIATPFLLILTLIAACTLLRSTAKPAT